MDLHLLLWVSILWVSAHHCVVLCVEVAAVTVQGVPEGVQPPVVTALSSSSLQLTWSEPTRPRGIIQQYRLNQTGVGTIFTHNSGPRSYTVTGECVLMQLHRLQRGNNNQTQI